MKSNEVIKNFLEREKYLIELLGNHFNFNIDEGFSQNIGFDSMI